MISLKLPITEGHKTPQTLVNKNDGEKRVIHFFKVQSLSNSKPLGFIKCRVVTLPDCRISWHSAVQFSPQTVANNRDNRTTGQANSINKQGWPGLVKNTGHIGLWSQLKTNIPENKQLL